MSDHVLCYRWINDEECDIYFDGILLYTMTHDQMGWNGMTGLRDCLNKLAETAGFDITIVGFEGI